MGEKNTLGIHSSLPVRYSSTTVRNENMLAGQGEGFKIAMNALNVGRIKPAAACLDAMRYH
jgi:alkylation response protein AidB-like acyl-CoA dehydrogenase